MPPTMSAKSRAAFQIFFALSRRTAESGSTVVLDSANPLQPPSPNVMGPELILGRLSHRTEDERLSPNRMM